MLKKGKQRQLHIAIKQVTHYNHKKKELQLPPALNVGNWNCNGRQRRDCKLHDYQTKKITFHSQLNEKCCAEERVQVS